MVTRLSSRSRHLPTFALTVVLLAGLWPASSRAKTASPTPPPQVAPTVTTTARTALDAGWHFGAEAVTDAPLDVGGRLWMEFPYGVRLTTTVGTLPSGYVSMVNGVLVKAGAYDQATADMVKGTISSSVAWRLQLGWRPFANRGFFFEAGYGLLSLSGGTSVDTIAAASGQAAPQPFAGPGHDFTVKSLVHLITAEIGWTWALWEHLTIRASVGVSASIGAKSTISRSFKTPYAKEADAYASTASATLSSILRDKLITPTVSLALGYQFF